MKEIKLGDARLAQPDLIGPQVDAILAGDFELAEAMSMEMDRRKCLALQRIQEGVDWAPWVKELFVE